MILKSAAANTLDQATAVLEDLKRTYQPKMDAGTLTDADKERIRHRLNLATELEARSRTESDFSLLGDLVVAAKRFFKTGHWGMSREEYIKELLALRQKAEAELAALRNHPTHQVL